MIAHHNNASDGVAVVVARMAGQSLLSWHGVLISCMFHLLFLTEDTFFLSVPPGQYPVPWDGGRPQLSLQGTSPAGTVPLSLQVRLALSWRHAAPQAPSKMQVFCKMQFTSLRFSDKPTKQPVG